MAKALSVPHGGGLRFFGLGCFFIPFFGMFLLVGSVFLYTLTIVPVMGVLTSGDWVETPCTMVVSEIEQKRGENGPVFVWNLTYQYTFGGATYRGDRYNFLSGWTSGSGQIQRKRANAYPQGRQGVCFVDPDNPRASVLNREFSAEMWWGLFPLPFVGLGAGGFIFLILRGRKRRAAERDGRQPAMLGISQLVQQRATMLGAKLVPAATNSGPIVLEPETNLVARMWFILGFAVFWNGIVSVFVFEAYQGWAAGAPDRFLLLFLMPFVLIGLGFILAVPYSLLKMLNPKPILKLSRSEIPLGESADLNWHFQGRVSSIQRLVLRLECQERATYRRGTDSHTDTSTLLSHTLFDSTGPEIGAGRVAVEIPFDAMHSFDAPDNKIVWTIAVQGDIPLRPDVSRSCAFHVTPHSEPRRG